MNVSRRTFISMSAGVIAGAAFLTPTFTNRVEAYGLKEEEGMTFTENLQVPYSTGRAVPTISVPKNACDCAHHIFDPVRFPYQPTDVRNQPPATVDVYQLLQKKLGLTRSVAVQPSAYGTDNRCLLDALRQLGRNARGVAVVANDISDKKLRGLHEGGVRGLRYNVSRGAVMDSNVILRMGERVKDMGWHLAFWMPADTAVAYADTFRRLAVPAVFDHRGHLPKDQGIHHPAFRMITTLMAEGKAWVKLSALYHDSTLANDYADTVAVGRAYVDAVPERVVWGTDWPHPSEFTAKKDFPDDAHLLDLLAKQAPDEKIRHRILVENPAELYGF